MSDYSIKPGDLVVSTYHGHKMLRLDYTYVTDAQIDYMTAVGLVLEQISDWKPQSYVARYKILWPNGKVYIYFRRIT